MRMRMVLWWHLRILRMVRMRIVVLVVVMRGHGGALGMHGGVGCVRLWRCVGRVCGISGAVRTSMLAHWAVVGGGRRVETCVSAVGTRRRAGGARTAKVLTRPGRPLRLLWMLLLLVLLLLLLLRGMSGCWGWKMGVRIGCGVLGRAVVRRWLLCRGGGGGGRSLVGVHARVMSRSLRWWGRGWILWLLVVPSGMIGHDGERRWGLLRNVRTKAAHGSDAMRMMR